ncbi:MAG: hypothetical protein K2H46_03295 [Muribaculaceae bacterium]|nr:hypothetical protein [Muribaculaceae bacterium]
MEDYNEIIKYLEPRRDIKASDELRKKVRNSIKRDYRIRIARKWLLGGISFSAVAALFLLVLIPSGVSAKEILWEAIDALRNSENIEMTVEVRTRPVENFRYINVNDDFVTHHIDIESTDSLFRWKVDKGERIAESNGTDTYTWLPSLNLGWHIVGDDKDNILGYLGNFLTPRKILEKEFEDCLSNKNAEYKVVKNGTDIILTVHSSPQGNFDNPYMLNSSIAESETIRRYVIDSDSKRLRRASVNVIANNREIEVLKVTSIDYDSQRKEIYKVDPNIRFFNIEMQPIGLIGLSAEEAASTILNAFADWNDSILTKVFIPEVSETAYRERFQGSTLISVGRSFKSGYNNSTFVPYSLKLKDGTTQCHNIALQKTEYGGWIVVGGL